MKTNIYVYPQSIARVYFVPSSRTLWGDTFGECSSCYTDEDPAWTCPVAVSAYADLGGSGADIVEVDGEAGK